MRKQLQKPARARGLRVLSSDTGGGAAAAQTLTRRVPTAVTEHRVVAFTADEHLDDGYRWRKYGQKAVRERATT